MMSVASLCFILLLFCYSSYSITNPGGCNQTVPADRFVFGPGKLDDDIPLLQAAPDTFQPLLGGFKINGWTMFNASVVQIHGLWCQVNPSVSFNTPVNWYTTTGLDTLDLVQTTRPAMFPYELFQCSNQTGVGLVGSKDFDSYQGIVKCNTTAPMLTTPREYYFSVYTFDNYRGPSIEPNMIVNVISRRDMDIVNFTISFNVTFGPPSRVKCRDALVGQDLLNIREAPFLSREVLQTHYFNSTVADTTRVTVTLNNMLRRFQIYSCCVIVEGYNATTGELIIMGTAVSNIAVSVASAPFNVAATQLVDSNRVFVEWSAPSRPPSFYEVFYRRRDDSQATSGGVVKTLSTTLAGLQRGELYYIYVVGFEENSNVFPSERSIEVTVMLADTLTTSESPFVVIYVSLMFVGWLLFFITLLIFVIFLIVGCCKRRRQRKNSSLPPVSATDPIRQDEELYDSIDQLDENNHQHNMDRDAHCTSTQEQLTRNNTTAVAISTDAQKNHSNTIERKAVVFNDATKQTSVYSNIDEIAERNVYTVSDEDITMRECDAYESATNSKNHQTHNEEDIAMTECDAYGVNHRPQPDIVNSKPNDQNTDDEEYVDVNDYV